MIPEAIAPTADDIIRLLQLSPHDEGGYYRQTYESDWSVSTPLLEGGDRRGLNSIFYLLTDSSPRGRLHRNCSDIIHFFHAGSPIEYWLVSPVGGLTRVILGPDFAAGQLPQFVAPGGCWKASRLISGNYGLLSEVVAPGFAWADRKLATAESFRQAYPELWSTLAPYVPHEIGQSALHFESNQQGQQESFQG